ncbi:SH3 domain-containing C40 family peptidase [Helicobacter burdigaliensis]|uniref:SH3 domain-containing C40 family peptidase n=1 Tax=Helicobacter burdigaliensis TaxID=2315334 RepID=UPI000EF71A2F|nr:SH3 domain-containing C40 family peptidase [Helicobacter burdigaliensis]
MNLNKRLGKIAYVSLLAILLLVGCATKEPKNHSITLPKQDLKPFITKDFTLLQTYSKKLKRDYLEHFFSPWNKPTTLSKNDVDFGLRLAYKNLGFGENLLPNSKEWIDSLKQEANLDTFPSLNKPAIITRTTNLRVLPTNKPKFHNPKLAGEGFPFDYWQNSSIYSGTPIAILHYSKNKSWAFVQSGFVSGWVNVLDIAILNNQQIKTLQSYKDFLVFTKDYTPLYTKQGEFLDFGRIGMLLPLIGSTKDFYEAQFITRTKRGYASFNKILLKTKVVSKFPTPFTKDSLSNLANPLLGEKYGWGGSFFNRDCSMLLRDLFGNFGFYLLRNSQSQIRQKDFKGDLNYFELSTLNKKEKTDFIIKNAIPFATFLGMKGHIMLYLGHKEGKIFVLHDIWGLKTLQNETEEGRYILGGIHITPLDIGKDSPNISQQNLLIQRVYGMKILFNKEDLKAF